MEKRLRPQGDPVTDSAAFFRNRRGVPHLDRAAHRPRLERCAALVDELVTERKLRTVSDLGCGDGGLLSLLTAPKEAWGYDVRRASVRGRRPGTRVLEADILTDRLDLGDLVVATEILEHLDDPHGWLGTLRPDVSLILASSPGRDSKAMWDHTHVWAWDPDGYAAMFTGEGYTVEHQEMVGDFQILVAS